MIATGVPGLIVFVDGGGGMGAASGVLIPGHGPALSPQLSCPQSKCRNLERGAGSWDTFTLGLPQAQQIGTWPSAKFFVTWASLCALCLLTENVENHPLFSGT